MLTTQAESATWTSEGNCSGLNKVVAARPFADGLGVFMDQSGRLVLVPAKALPH